MTSLFEMLLLLIMLLSNHKNDCNAFTLQSHQQPRTNLATKTLQRLSSVRNEQSVPAAQDEEKEQQSSSSSAAAAAAAAPIIISGINIHVTPALDEYVHKRIGRALSKFSGSVQECDVALSVSKNPKIKNGHRVEIVTDIKGTTIICKNESPDMYESIDLAAHALTRKLIKYKERRNEGHHGGLAMGADLKAALEALESTSTTDDPTTTRTYDWDPDDGFFYEEAATPYQPTVTPVKSFQLDRPISLEEAIFALDYVDHDFYVFRNIETKEINVVYKRHTGGIGLVAPESASSSQS